MRTLGCAMVLVATGVVLSCGGGVEQKGDGGSASNNGTVSNNGVDNNGVDNNGCGDSVCPGDCLDDGWCYADRHSQAFYQSMWVKSVDEIWLAEQFQMVRVGSGTTWEERPLPERMEIRDIIGRGDDVFVATPDAVWRWNGAGWDQETVVAELPDGRGFTSFAADHTTSEIFLGSDAAILERRDGVWQVHGWAEGPLRRNVANCDGQRWFPIEHPVQFAAPDAPRAHGIPDYNLFGMSGHLTDGTLVGGGEHVVMFDDQGWSTVPSRFLNRVKGVGGTGPHDVWLVVSTDEIMHYDGTYWRNLGDFTADHPVGVLGLEPGVGRMISRDGKLTTITGDGSVEDITPGPGLAVNEDRPVQVVSAGEFYVSTGTAVHRWTEAVGWSRVASEPRGLVSMWFAAPDDGWFVAERGDVERTDGATSTGVDLPNWASGVEWTTVRGSSSSNVWLASESVVAQFDGTSWTQHPDFAAGGTGGVGRTHLSVSDDFTIAWRAHDAFLWDGASWSPVGRRSGLGGVGCEGGELFTVGGHELGMFVGSPDNPSIDGESFPEYSLWRSWMTSKDDVWVIGQNQTGRVRKFDGDGWAVSLANPGLQLADIEFLPDGTGFLLGTTELLTRDP